MRTAIDLVGPDCPPLHVQSSPDSSRLFSMFTTGDSGVVASAQRRRRSFDHLRKCLISNETTELASGRVTLPDSCSARVRFHLCRENISKFCPSAFIDMWVPIVIYSHHVLHLPKLCPSFSLFSHTQHCVGILKIANLFDCASYEDVLCMNVDQHDVNWLVVPFSTMNKTSNMMLSLFEKGVLI